MDVLILGVNHQIQSAHIKNWSTDGSFQRFEQQQKEAFAQHLGDLIHDRGIEFVGEEAQHGEEMICQRVCAEICRYANIEMTPEERAARNIPPGYAENRDLPEAEKLRCHRQREEYMCTNAFRKAGQVNRLLIICGRLHAESISAELRRQGHQVEVADIQQQCWYIEDWTGHYIRNL